VARTCRSLDLERALPIIREALTDVDSFVRGHAEDTVQDLETFLGIKVPI
jgi:hypothetical protein